MARIPRRDLLATAAGTWFLAPFLRARRAEAQSAFPRRLVLFFTGNSHPEEFFPTGTGTSFTLTEPMRSFVGLEKELLFIRPVHHTASFGNHHQSGPMNLFTGAGFGKYGGGTWPTGPSIDHVVAPVLSVGVPRRTYHINMQEGTRTDGRGFTTYSGPGQPVPGERDPARIVEAIFGGTSGGKPAPGPMGGTQPVVDKAEVEARRKAQAAILTVNTEELREIQRFLGRDEKAKLDLHVGALEDLGRQIAGTPANGDTVVSAAPPVTRGACMAPSVASGAPAMRNAAQLGVAIDSYFSILANAFACDQLRVASVQIGGSGDDYPGFLGFNSSWHDNVAHKGRGGGMPRELYKQHLAYFAEKLAAFAKKLAAMKEGDGSVLDHTVILWGVEVGINHNHSPKDMPYLVAGGRGLGIKTGQFLAPSESQPATKLLTGVCNALGVPVRGLGTDPEAGPLAGML